MEYGSRTEKDASLLLMDVCWYLRYESYESERERFCAKDASSYCRLAYINMQIAYSDSMYAYIW